jgi:hypothetical protein
MNEGTSHWLWMPSFFSSHFQGISIVNRTQFLALALALLGFAGCGSVSVTTNPTPVEVSVNVTSGGKPVDDVQLVLLALDDKGGGQAQGEVAKGKAKLSVYPGKYTYYVAEGKSDASFKKVPKAYHGGAMDRTIEVSSGKEIEIKLD